VQFELTEIQRDIQKAAREFADKEFEPDLALELEREMRFPRSIFEKACRLGFVGIDYPESFGGQSFGLFESILVVEEFTRKDSGIGIAMSLADIGSGVVLRHGDEGQRKRFLPSVAQGKSLLPGGVVDSPRTGGGSPISEHLTPKGDGIIFSGTSWIPLGSLSDCMVIVGPPTRAGMSPAMIVNKKWEGIVFSEAKKTMGMRIAPVAEITFREVEVPGDHLLSAPDQICDPRTTYRHIHRIKTAAQALGIGQAALDRAVKHAKEREQFGRRIAQFQGIQFMLAELYTQIEAARSLVYRAACGYDLKSPEVEKISSAAKLFTTEMAVRATLDSIQIHGGVGLMKEYSIERMLRDAKTIQNLEEGNLLQKTLIGRRVALS
jgi:acyl-CoA dehydrogenase